MAVLTRPEILKLIKSKELTINPYQPKNIGPASIDFHLDNSFRVFKRSSTGLVVGKKFDYKKVTKLITNIDSLNLLPGQSAHGITVESLTLPQNICGWIQGKSSLARIGLMVHITANFIHPGTSGKQVLEMTNAGPIPLTIKVGIPICQIILEETKGRAQYQGKYVNQQTP
jgi:dCTP deaminase